MRNVPICSTPVTRADIAAWIVVALALGLVIELHLLSGLLAGLLVFKLVDVLTPWLRLRALGRDGPRVLAVTLIAIGRDRRAHRHWHRVRNAHAQQRRERPAAHGEDGADHRRCPRHSPGRTAGLRARRLGNPAAHDRRMAAIECGSAATRRARHRPLRGPRAHGHDHRRAALHAEGRASARAPPAHRAHRAACRPFRHRVPARGVRAVLDFADQHLLHVAVSRRGAARCSASTCRW